MMASWQLNQKTRLSLKQLGFSADQVHQGLHRYRNKEVELNEESFLHEFARSVLLGSYEHTLLRKAAQLPLSWKPEADLYQLLSNAGYTVDAIHHYRDLFVVLIREEGRVVRNPDGDFRRFCQARPKQLPSPITPDWQPSQDTLDLLARNHLSVDFVLSLVPEFILYWKDVGRVMTDWQSVFVKRVLACAEQSKRYGSNSDHVDQRLRSMSRET